MKTALSDKEMLLVEAMGLLVCVEEVHLQHLEDDLQDAQKDLNKARKLLGKLENLLRPKKHNS